MSTLNDHAKRLVPTIENDLKTMLSTIDHYPSDYTLMLRYHMGWVDEHGNALPDGDGGKRLRPLLCLMVCESVGGSIEYARPAGAAVEFIHNFSLLHDDIQDQSPLRRGKPTVWKVWGQAQAINAGDAMFTLAHLAIPTLAPEDVDSRMLTQMMRILDSVSLELTRGQHLDLAFEQQNNVTKEKYLDMVDGKTAALISGAAEMGALAGGSTALEHFKAFGHSLGMAFQILDDMLDIWGDPELTGKQRAVDIYQRKKSLPVLYGVEKSKELRAIYQKTDPFDDHDVGNVVNLLGEVGARDYATKLAEEYTTSTIESLEAALPNETDRERLLTFANTMLKRDH